LYFQKYEMYRNCMFDVERWITNLFRQTHAVINHRTNVEVT